MARSVAASRARRGRHLDEVAGILLLFLAALVLLALLSYDSGDPSWFQDRPSPGGRANWAGWVGSNLAEALLQLAGLAAFLVPVMLAAIGWNRLRGRGAVTTYGKVVGHVVAFLGLGMLAQLTYGTIQYGGETFGAGGDVLGTALSGAGISLLGRAGALLLSLLLLAAGIVLATRFSFGDAVQLAGEGAVAGGRSLVRRAAAFAEERRRAAQKRAVERKHARLAAEAERARAEAAAAAPVPEPDARPRVAPPAPEPPVARPRPARKEKEKEREKAEAAQPRLPLELPGEDGFVLPPLDLLNEPSAQPGEDEKELLARGRQITEKMHEFQVEGQVVGIHPGPVVTVFEFKPEAGVKYSKIVGMVDDLCLGLKAESVRIDRLPGRSTVGIEVPNRRQETIYPRELLGSDTFRSSRSKLTLALGKDISGQVYTAELDRMPHLLIAGATGAGKSVGLNGMIASILYKATPADVRFIMIDTKMIELGIYADIPHLLIPVVTEPKLASTALKWAVKEMESRYRQLASVGVRNLEQFNALLAAEPGRAMTDEKTGQSTPLRRLPFIVIVIDEMADLMMVSSADVEESVMRLAQMARAVGIHLILATQRPSVDVITGTIKANFPARVAFRVSQRVDSRTIIDQGGAEHLLGRGDMLYLPSGSARLTRVHGGYITEAELNRITAHLKHQARPVYDESVLKDPEEEKGPNGEGIGERDTMFPEAVRLVLQEGQCSITLIQRRMRLGYARAARLVDAMEREGIVGPADGSRPREVLVGPEILETLG